MPRSKVCGRRRDERAPASPEASHNAEGFLDAHDYDISWPIRENEVTKYLEVRQRAISRTRFIRRSTLEVECCMWDGFKKLLDPSGLGFFFGCQEIGYEELIHEFYTTARTDDNVHFLLHCRLKGNEVEITPRLLRKIFKLSKSKQIYFKPDESVGHVWDKLGGGEKYHISGGQKSAYLKDTFHCIFHKFLAHAFFGKSESNKISGLELFILWRACNDKAADLGTLLFNRLVDCSKGVGGKNLVLGHVITRIAAYKGYIEPADLDGWEPVTGKDIDVKTLQHAYIINMSDPKKPVPWYERPAYRNLARGDSAIGSSSGMRPEDRDETADEDEPDMGGHFTDTPMPDVQRHDHAGPSTFHTDSMDMMREYFDRLNARFDSVEVRFDGINTSMENMDARMRQIESNQNNFYSQISSQVELMGTRLQEFARHHPQYTQSPGYSPSQPPAPP